MDDAKLIPPDIQNKVESADITTPVMAPNDSPLGDLVDEPPVYVRPARSRYAVAGSPLSLGIDAQELNKKHNITDSSDYEISPTNEIRQVDAEIPLKSGPITGPLLDVDLYTESTQANGESITNNHTLITGFETSQEGTTALQLAPESLSVPIIKAPKTIKVDNLPTTTPAGDLPRVRLRKRWVALCFGLTALVYLALVPLFLNYSSPPTGDQPFYLMDTISIVQDGDLNVKNNYDNHDEDKFYSLAPHPKDFVGMAAPYPLPAQIGPTTARPSTEWYGAHLPGLAVALIPAWIIGSWFSLWWPATIVFMCLVGALVAVNVFLFAYELTGKLWIAFAVWVPIAFSNPVMTYSYLLFTELATGLLVIYAFRRLAMGWAANGPIRLAVIALCIGYIPWLAWRAAPIAILLGLYASVQWIRYWHNTRLQKAKPSKQQAVDSSEAVYYVQAGWRDEVAGETNTAKVSPWFTHAYTTGRGTDLANQNLQTTSAERTSQSVNIDKGQLESAQNEQKPITTPKALPTVLWALIPLIISGILLAIYNRALYGSLVPVSIADPNYYFQWPWTGQENLIKFSNAVLGIFFDQQSGLLPYAPIYLLVFVGAIALFRSARRTDRGLLLWLAIITLPYLGVVAGFSGWNGVWCPPARYMTTFAPLMAGPLAMSLYSLTRTRLQRFVYIPLYTILALPGLLLMGVIMHDARLMWPAPSGAVFNWLNTDPASPLKINFLKWLPANTFPDEVRQPQLSAYALGISFGVIFLGYALMLRRRVLLTDEDTLNSQTTSGVRQLKRDRAKHRIARDWPLVAHGTVWLLALGIVAYSWYMGNFKFLEPKTILTQKSIIGLSPPVDGGEGMSFADNKLYITAYLGQTVGVLDLSTGVYTLLQPTLPNGSSFPFFHPGDVKVGPDGLLYVLNNGPGEQALLVMQPDGRIVRQVPLVGKTPIAIGLVFAPDGSIYVSDMTGAKILKYGPNFGDPLEAFGGIAGAFNNVAGITIDKDGTIYAAESSPPTRIQQIDASGKFVREFKLECSPQFMTISGDWLDVGCTTGIISVNKLSGEIQTVRYAENSVKSAAPTSIAYGSDGTLYVLDVDKVIAYTVQH